ncbi:helix-turn-helix domain-containing protein [Accumulibacter sp.]|uniref:helix-turn-helix domain-containing protein n=1 Tax=Accumulibacter sp. TaxID=2053492 RepID=UPI0025E50C6A|nr:helix-turn-helix domain-containing protein [Accumulibacter sp.]MCM8613709.1 helix-turn-helix domain-containing protein [Accumulibacter sp.]MCM8637395.1 helix-turn-helix domain-containing protein [Accumulibacter sp.]MCM8640889.1 helix-turn-helix domain-containing protein [Accumulibacter sp.]
MSEQGILPLPPDERPAAAAPTGTAGGSPATAAGGVGHQLRAAREGRGLSLAEVAQSLKLGQGQVAAIENEDWQLLPGNTMIRGFVRNYARLFNLDVEQLMRGLDAARLEQKPQLAASAGTSPSLPSSSGRRAERRDYLAALGGLLLLALAVLVYFFAPLKEWQARLSEMIESRSMAPHAERAQPAPVLPTATDSTPRAASAESVTSVSPPNATVLAAAASSSADAAPAGGGDLRLSFAQSAWVEVRDAMGQTIVSGMMPAASQREVGGQAPFSLVIGNATQVTLQYRGRMIDLAPHSKGDVARLTVE